MLLTLDKRIRVTDRGPYVIDRDVVLALHLVEVHSSGQTSKNNRYRQACTEDYGLSMTDLRINNNPVLWAHDELIIPYRACAVPSLEPWGA